jgi:hypothetical protein
MDYPTEYRSKPQWSRTASPLAASRAIAIDGASTTHRHQHAAPVFAEQRQAIGDVVCCGIRLHLVGAQTCASAAWRPCRQNKEPVRAYARVRHNQDALDTESSHLAADQVGGSAAHCDMRSNKRVDGHLGTHALPSQIGAHLPGLQFLQLSWSAAREQLDADAVGP